MKSMRYLNRLFAFTILVVGMLSGLYFRPVLMNPTSANSPMAGANYATIPRVSPAADLAVTMTDSPDPVSLNADLTYTLTVSNNGDLNASGVTLSDTLPAGSTFVSASSSQGSCSGATTLSCNLGALNLGAKATITIVSKPPAQETITNKATVTGNEPDPNLANNTASQETQVRYYDLAVMTFAINDRAVPGGRIYWLATVTNLAGGAVN